MPICRRGQRRHDRRLDPAAAKRAAAIEKLSASDFGPGSAEYAKVKSILTAAGIIPESSTSVDMRQAVNKSSIGPVPAAQAGRAIYDEALSAAQHANPNLDLTRAGQYRPGQESDRHEPDGCRGDAGL